MAPVIFERVLVGIILRKKKQFAAVQKVNNELWPRRFPTVRAAVASYVQEVKLLAAQLENLTRERDKLKLDIQVRSNLYRSSNVTRLKLTQSGKGTNSSWTSR